MKCKIYLGGGWSKRHSRVEYVWSVLYESDAVTTDGPGVEVLRTSAIRGQRSHRTGSETSGLSELLVGPVFLAKQGVKPPTMFRLVHIIGSLTELGLPPLQNYWQYPVLTDIRSRSTDPVGLKFHRTGSDLRPHRTAGRYSFL